MTLACKEKETEPKKDIEVYTPKTNKKKKKKQKSMEPPTQEEIEAFNSHIDEMEEMYNANQSVL